MARMIAAGEGGEKPVSELAGGQGHGLTLTRTAHHSYTCFEHYCAHHQEVKIVLYSIWYHHTL